jgi:glyoxylase-like metal-dependent hydrolase (beta-lactamase superfamily II)
MSQQLSLASELRADDPERDEARDDGTHEIAPDVAYQRLGIVNVVFVGPQNAGDRGWVLVDAGLPGTAGLIRSAAEARFGNGARPAAIAMTHGHFDHVGALESLAEEWDAPVYAHPLEIPYLNGTAAYPPPDPSVGGGLMARLSPLFPRKPVDVSSRLKPFPDDGLIPFLPDWRWLHTPGHSVGHVSFWRESDRTLIVGDAFVTTAQESIYSAITQEPEMHGPPMYFTHDWGKARYSVERLASLDPEIVVTGHGRAMRGDGMREALRTLARGFDRLAVPTQGRYTEHPARSEDGSAYRSA